MKVKRVINVVGTECRPGTDDRFNAWYEEHIEQLMRFEGMKGATRFRRVGDSTNGPRYLCIYEFETPEDFKEYDESEIFAEAERKREAFWGDEAFDVVWRVQYEKISSREGNK